MTEEIYYTKVFSKNCTSMIVVTPTVHRRNIRVSYLKAIGNVRHPTQQGLDLETFIISVGIALHKPSKPKHDNLTKSERSALYDLQNRLEIIIKPADKGSAVVVMDRDHYISEAERQLGDSTYSRLLDRDPTPEFVRQVSEAISEITMKAI